MNRFRSIARSLTMVALLVAANVALPQDPRAQLSYTVSLANPEQHLVEVRITLPP